MLIVHLPFFVFFVFFVISFLFLQTYKTQEFSFYKIWVLFFFFCLCNACLGFLGEDFFVVLAVAVEFPVFFSFFFFLTTKNQINVEVSKKASTTAYSFFLAMLTVTFFYFLLNPQNVHSVTFWNVEDLSIKNQKSDFFLFFLFFYIIAPQTVLLVGAFITLATLFLVYVTFNAQVFSLYKIKKNKDIAWAKNQNQTTQSNQKNSTLFFKA